MKKQKKEIEEIKKPIRQNRYSIITRVIALILTFLMLLSMTATLIIYLLN